MKLLQPRRLHPIKIVWVVAVLVAFTIYTSYRDRPARLWRWTGDTMGSYYTVQVVSRALDEASFAQLQRDVEADLHRINDEMSTWLTNSVLSRFNARASTEPYEVSPWFVDVTRLSLDVSRVSGGAFDVTFSPMFNLWGFGKQGPKHVPSAQAIADTMAICGYRHLDIVATNRIRKDIPQLQMVFNAIVPGAAAQRLTGLLADRGFTNTYVDVGGEIVARGRNAHGEPWRVGIETPEYDAPLGEDLEAVVRLSDRALATSGDYRNYFKDENGVVFAHIFDPRIGRPATGHVASVTVIATNGALADALATTLFVMGPDEGIPWLTNVPDAQVLFIMRDSDTTFREIASPDFERVAGYRAREGVVTASEAR